MQFSSDNAIGNKVRSLKSLKRANQLISTEELLKFLHILQMHISFLYDF